MKNKVFLLLAVLSVFVFEQNVQAQYSHLYYHCVGDTIQYNTPIYYHNWWGFETSYHNRTSTGACHIKHLFEKKILSYYFTPTPLKVIGIAAFYPFLGWNQYTNSYLPPRKQEYILLYEATIDSFYEVKSVPWQASDDTTRYIRLRGRRPYHSDDYEAWSNDPSVICCDGVRWDRIVPVVEYYFDSAIVVQDSFYVGLTDNSTLPPFDDSVLLSGDVQFWYALNNFRQDCEGRIASNESGNNFCGLYWPSIRIGYSFGITGLAAFDTLYTNYDFVPMVFPIIMVDTTEPPAEYCPPVENLQVHNMGGDTVEVTWDAHPDHRYGYEVQYGTVGQPLSAWTTIWCERNYALIMGLQMGRSYNLRVRPYCDSEKIDTGDWCRSVFFTVQEGTDVGLAPSPLSQHTTLSPNPATSSVTVSSDYIIMSLDLYDAAGRHLWSQPENRRSETIDVSNYAAGRYLLMITTSQGTTAKAFIKQ